MLMERLSFINSAVQLRTEKVHIADSKVSAHSKVSDAHAAFQAASRLLVACLPTVLQNTRRGLARHPGIGGNAQYVRSAGVRGGRVSSLISLVEFLLCWLLI